MAVQDPLIGGGLKFPVNVNARGGLNMSWGPQRIQDAIRIILSTSPGERLMRPTFGAGAQDYVFESNSSAKRAQLAEDIKHSLTLWEPRIELVDVTVAESPRGESSVLVTLSYRIRGTNELQNMVYPLSVQEGLG